MSDQKFATAINCIDGRAQKPVIDYICKFSGVQYVDMITEAGAVKALTDTNNQALIDSAHEKATISVEKHGSENLYVAAHADCAGNPVDDSVQKEQVLKLVEVVRGWFPDANVAGLWVNQSWKVEKVEAGSTKA